MTEQGSTQQALAGMKVLDLTSAMGTYCTKLMADLGADVIRIEKPCGDASRKLGPFYRDEADPEKSLYFLYFNTNKRSVTLDLETADGQEIFRKLVKNADVVVECFAPGYLDNLGLGYSALKEINPALVMTSITGFGQTGPYKDYKTSDLIGWAMGGLMYVTGTKDRPPLYAYGYQAYLMTSVFAACGTMTAHLNRLWTGKGQQVDVSMQECVASQMEQATMKFCLNGEVTERNGAQHPIAAPCNVYPCKDGYWAIIANSPQMWNAFVEWVISEDIGVETLLKEEYQFQPARHRDLETVLNPIIVEFGMRHTKAELYEEGQHRRVPVAPASTPEDVVKDIQLKAREYFIEVDHPSTGPVMYPGAPFKMTATPWKIIRPAPQVGQHNEEIYASLGLSKAELVAYKEAGVI